MQGGGAVAAATALQGAFGTVIVMTGLPGGERFEQTLLGQSEKACRLLTLHTGEIGEKGVESIAFLIHSFAHHPSRAAEGSMFQ
jgi:hypothetical protein